jgi:Phosphotransferase enzyme family
VSWKLDRSREEDRLDRGLQEATEAQKWKEVKPFMSIERTRHAVSGKWVFRSTQSAQAGARVSVPEDPAIPGLSLLRHPQKFSEVLTPLLKGRFGRDVCVEQTHHSVRRHVPGKRCIVKLEVLMRSAPGAPVEQHRILAKYYSGDHGATVFENCQELWRRGFSIGDFRIAEPIAYHSQWQILFLSWESGRTLRDFLIAGEDTHRAIEGAATWLLKLHACRFRGGRIYGYQRHFHTLGVWERNLASAHREMGDEFRSIRKLIKKELAKCKKGPRVPTHRDFSPEHLVVEEDRFVGLDLDEFCQYDPLFDVAHFIAHLRFLALTSFGALDYFDSQAARFEQMYASGSGVFSKPRMQLLLAIAFLKLAYLEAVVHRMKDGKKIVFKLLQAANQFARP